MTQGEGRYRYWRVLPVNVRMYNVNVDMVIGHLSEMAATCRSTHSAIPWTALYGDIHHLCRIPNDDVSSSIPSQYLSQCDEVVYMRDCQLAERGTHEQLMQMQGGYYQLVSCDAASQQQQQPPPAGKSAPEVAAADGRHQTSTSTDTAR